MTDLLTRARNMSAMLRMCEKISFGSDADVIDELVDEVERLKRGLMGAAMFARSNTTISKIRAEIDRLRPEYQSNSMLDHGRRQMLDHFEKILNGPL